jgi:hypothetical protein
VKKMGATMRLVGAAGDGRGGFESLRTLRKALIMERHRHRFEVNPRHIEELEKGGWKFTGRSADGVKMEIGGWPVTILCGLAVPPGVQVPAPEAVAAALWTGQGGGVPQVRRDPISFIITRWT